MNIPTGVMIIYTIGFVIGASLGFLLVYLHSKL